MPIYPPTPENCARLQRPDRHSNVPEGFPTLLRGVIGSQKGLYCAALCGHVDHYQYNNGDHSWSCGWRNIQMTSSHIVSNKESWDKVFGGAGFVPDVPSLQAWLECAWQLGFDPDGAKQLRHHVQGKHTWIGTTEAATLLRQFGVRARVVDFVGGKRARKQQRSHNTGRQRGPSQLRGSSGGREGSEDADGGAGSDNDDDDTEDSDNECSEDGEGQGQDTGVRPRNLVRVDGGAAESEVAGNKEDEQQGAGESSVEARRHAPPEEDRAEQLRGASECDRGGRLRGASEDPEDADEGDLERVTVRQGGGGRQGGEAVHHGIRCDMCSEGPIRGSRYQSKWLSKYDLCQRCHDKPEAKKNAPYAEVTLVTPREARLVDHRQLVQWCWNYFTDELSSGAEPPMEAHDNAWREHIEDNPVILSGKPPIYFQHQGHSRTLIGVERLQLHEGHAAEVSLLLLEPGLRLPDLVTALRQGRGWQDMLKRNLCTLKKSEYQLMYIAAGLAEGKELVELKKMHAMQKFC